MCASSEEFDAEWEEQPLPTLIDNGYALLEMLRDEVSDTDSPLHKPLPTRGEGSLTETLTPASARTSPAAQSGDPTTCAICLDTLKKHGARRRLVCGHVFHVKCVTKWIKARAKKGQPAACPLCRVKEPGRMCIR